MSLKVFNNLIVWNPKDKESKKQYDDFFRSFIKRKARKTKYSDDAEYYDLLDFNIHVPEPKNLKEKLLIKWRMDNWGTSGNQDSNIIDREYQLEIMFDTINSTPFKWVEKIVELYPKLDLHYMWEIEGNEGYYYYSEDGKLKEGDYEDYKNDM